MARFLLAAVAGLGAGWNNGPSMKIIPFIVGALPQRPQEAEVGAGEAAGPGSQADRSATGEGAGADPDGAGVAETPPPFSWDDPTLEGALGQEIFYNTVQEWLIAAGILVALLVLLWIVRRILAIRAAKIASRTRTSWYDLPLSIVRDIRVWLIFPALLHVAAQSLILPAAGLQTLKIIAVVGVAMQLLITSRLIVDFSLNMLLRRFKTPQGEPDPTVASSMGVLRVMAFVLIGAIVLLLALDNLGIEITPMLTGLGIGGIAVALALQNILGDLFGSLTIILDKPFVVGDFIIVGDKMGTVEKIGIKTTRLRALSGEQLIFSNNDLLSSRIQNYKRMFERRIVFGVGVVYESTGEQLKAIPGIIRAAVEAQDQARFDRAHFKTFGAYSLDFETVYYVKVPDFNTYMDVQQAINLELFEKFAAAGIDFAYPTQVEIQRSEKEPPSQFFAPGSGGAGADGDTRQQGAGRDARESRATNAAGDRDDDA